MKLLPLERNDRETGKWETQLIIPLTLNPITTQALY